jgi:exodeoxyribonuclease V alpha subunit
MQSLGSGVQPPIEILSGVLERVTYHNAENGFCVLRVKARGQRDLIVVTGHAAVINAGEFISATGSWVNDREHGLQFKATHVHHYPADHA